MMKKSLQILTALVLVLGFSAGGVAAQDESSIENTGPGSENEIISEEECSVLIENNTDLDVTNNNDQQADTGNSTNEGNTEGGDASSGEASNENQTSITIEVDNEGNISKDECLRQAKEAQPNGGQGDNGGDNGDVPRDNGQVLGEQDGANLPDSGLNETAAAFGLGLAAIAGIAGLSRLSLVAYRRFNL